MFKICLNVQIWFLFAALQSKMQLTSKIFIDYFFVCLETMHKVSNFDKFWKRIFVHYLIYDFICYHFNHQTFNIDLSYVSHCGRERKIQRAPIHHTHTHTHRHLSWSNLYSTPRYNLYNCPFSVCGVVTHFFFPPQMWSPYALFLQEKNKPTNSSILFWFSIKFLLVCSEIIFCTYLH